jgi:4-hydroxy-tetrahydrodipicolinate synthase
MFEGSIVAIVTPMKGGEVDEASLKRLLKHHRQAGTQGIVPAGCTGEAATLTFDERMRVLEICLEEMGDETPVIAGTGSNSTRETIRLTSAARRAGAHGALIIPPYYNKPTPAGQYEHYRAVAEEVDVPIVLYNVPGRTGTNMLPETVARLAEFPNIVAIKEAAGSVDRVSAILELADITVLSGDDHLTLPMMAVGAEGVVSVTANVLPATVREMVASYPDDPARALGLHRALRPVSNGLFVETNPGPVKHALAELGLIDSAELRPPLVEVTESTKQAMRPIIETIRKLAGSV